MKKFKFIASVFIFVGGGVFLAIVLFLHLNSKKSENFPSSRAYIMKMRVEAIEKAKKEGKGDYQFEISSPLPFSLPYVSKEEQ